MKVFIFFVFSGRILQNDYYCYGYIFNIAIFVTYLLQKLSKAVDSISYGIDLDFDINETIDRFCFLIA